MTLSALALYGVGGGAGLWALNKAKARAELSLAKHRSLAGPPAHRPPYCSFAAYVFL